MLGNVPIKTAARLMQKSEMFVRMGLRSGALPFGVAYSVRLKRPLTLILKLIRVTRMLLKSMTNQRTSARL